MIIVDENNRVILHGKEIELFPGYAKIGRNKFSPPDMAVCTIYQNMLPDGFIVGQTLFDGTTFIKTQESLQAELEQAKQVKTEFINTLAANLINAGFASDALGTMHTYQSELHDQLNLIGLAAITGDKPMKCSVDGEVWEYKIHTQAQRQKVLADGATDKHDILSQALIRKQEINSATTLEAIELIDWI